MTGHTKGISKQRQDPLRERYRIAANEAYIVDSAKTVRDGSEDPFHSTVAPGDGYGALWRVGIHRAVGGFHDLPNPGDILCAALASCLLYTFRIIADRLANSFARSVVTTRAEARAPR